MVRALSSILLFLTCLQARATLVAIVPARDGVVVAADSRFTFLGAPCDGAFKIIAPQRPKGTVAVVTGASMFVTPAPAGQKDPCEYLMNAHRLLDAGAVVRKALEQGRDSTEELRAVCVDAVRRFREKYPEALGDYAGRDIFLVVVANYDAARGVSRVRQFVVRMDTQGKVEAGPANVTEFNAQSASRVLVFGEAEWMQRTVIEGTGGRFLDEQTLSLLRGQHPVERVSREAAEHAARNVVEAAERAAKSDPPPSGVGGTVRVVVVDGGR